MLKKILSCAGLISLLLVFLGRAFSQTKLYPGTGINISGSVTSSIDPNIYNISAISDGADGYYIIWADYSGPHTPNLELNDNYDVNVNNVNANIYARHLKGDGTNYGSTSDTGTLITDSYDQVDHFKAYPYQGGFVVFWSTSTKDDDLNTFNSLLFAQRYNAELQALWSGAGDGSDSGLNKSIQLTYASPKTLGLTVSGNLGYYLANNSGLKIMAINLSDGSDAVLSSNGITVPQPQYILKSLAMPSYDSAHPGILVALQGIFDNSGYNHIRAWRYDSQGLTSGWDQAGVYVTYASTPSTLDPGTGPESTMNAACEKDGPCYIVWYDTRTGSGIYPGIYGAKITGTALPDSNFGAGYLISQYALPEDITDLIMPYHLTANNGKISVIAFDGLSSSLFFQIRDTNNSWSSPFNDSMGMLMGGVDPAKEKVLSVSSATGNFLAAFDTGAGVAVQVLTSTGGYIFTSTPTVEQGSQYKPLGTMGLGDKMLLTFYDGSSNPELYAQLLSTAIPPLDPLSNTSAIWDSGHGSYVFNWTDSNALEGTRYLVQMAASSDFGKIILSTTTVYSDPNPQGYYINGLTPGKRYWFRVKASSGIRENDFVSSYIDIPPDGKSYTNGFIGNWDASNGGGLISNTALPSISGSGAISISAGAGKTFLIWPDYDFSSGSATIKGRLFNADGTEGWTKDLVSRIPFNYQGQNDFGAAADNNGGFIIIWSSAGYVDSGSSYVNFARYSPAGNLLWSKNLNSGNAVPGFDNDFKVSGNNGFIFYADNLANVYTTRFALADGTETTISMTDITITGDFITQSATSPAAGSYIDGEIIFYGAGGAASSIHAKRVGGGSSENWTKNYSLTNVSDSVLIPDGDSGAYFIWVDTITSINPDLYIFRIDKDGNAYSGYPKILSSGLYKTAWGKSYFSAIDTPWGPAAAYYKDNTGNPEVYFGFLDKTTNDWRATWPQDMGAGSPYTDDIKLSYNAPNDVVAGVVSFSETGIRKISVVEFKAQTGTKILGPALALNNMYGLNPVPSITSPFVETSGDYFIVGAALPENIFIQQVSTAVSLEQPSSLAFSATDKNSVSLTWTQTDSEITEWTAQASSDNFSHITELNHNNTLSLTFISLQPNTTYQFRIQASSNGVYSPFTAPITTSTLADLPSSLVINAVTDGTAGIQWSANGNGPGTQYQAVISSVSDYSSNVSTYTTSALTYSFTGLQANTTYYLKVRTLGNNTGDITAFTGIISTKTLVALPQNAPNPFTSVSEDMIQLTWLGNNPGEVSFEAKTSTCDLSGTISPNCTVVSSDTLNQTATFGNGGEGTLAPNTTYYFSVRAYNGTESSLFVYSGSTSTWAQVTAAPAPGAITQSSVDINWTDASNGPGVKYLPYLDADNNFTSGSVPGTLTAAMSQTFSGLSPNTTYYFAVKAINNLGVPTDYSPSVEALTKPAVPAAAGTPFTGFAADSLTAAWADGGNAAGISYLISAYKSADSSLIASSETVKLSAAFGNGGEGTLSANTSYYFMVKAKNLSGDSFYLAIGTASTNAAVPSAPSIVSAGTGTVSLDWTDSVNGPSVQYTAYRSLDSGLASPSAGALTALTSYSFADLNANTTYYFAVKAKGNNGDTTAFTGIISTITYTLPPGAAPYTAIAKDAITGNWTDGGNGGDLNYYAELFKTKDDISAGNSGNIGVLTNAFSSLSPNTSYYMKVKIISNGRETAYTQLPSTYTLAEIPAAFVAGDIWISSVSFNWNENGNTSGTIYRLRYTSPRNSGSADASGASAIITGLTGGTTYTFTLAAVNGNGVETAVLTLNNVITLPELSLTKSVDSSGGILNFKPSNGDITVTVPPGAFSSALYMTLVSPSTFPATSASNMAKLTPTNVGLEVTLSVSAQPAKTVQLVIGYGGDPAFSSLNQDTLVIARYEPVSGVWIPLKSSVDKVNKKVTAYTEHLSLFRIMSVTLSSAVNAVKIAPNPLRPSKGGGYSSMTFSNLPPGASIKIYGVAGEKVRELTADPAGMALWDGKNDGGSSAATGVYFVFIKSGSQTKTVKIGVQR